MNGNFIEYDSTTKKKVLRKEKQHIVGFFYGIRKYCKNPHQSTKANP